jgi:hypothetical protein
VSEASLAEAPLTEALAAETPVDVRHIDDVTDGEAQRDTSPVPDALEADVQISGDDPSALGEVSAPRSEATSAGGARDPFGDVWSTPDQASYRSALIGEGIFQLKESSQVAETVAPEPEPAVAEESGEAERMDAVRQASMDDEAVAPAVAESTEPAEATVTLGKLYLEQGYAEEAEGIFRAVLEREPGNPEAEAGLKESLGTDQELMAAGLVDADVLAAASSVGRKRLVLEGYAARIRAASKKERDV